MKKLILSVIAGFALMASVWALTPPPPEGGGDIGVPIAPPTTGGNNIGDPPPPPPEDDCECECEEPNNTGATMSKNGSVDLRINFGQFPFHAGVRGGSLQIYSPYADPILFTPSGLSYRHPTARRIVKNKNGAVNIYTQNGYVDYYSIAATGVGKTTGSSTYLNQYLYSCDENGTQVSGNSSPFYKECFPDRTALIYNADSKIVIKYITREGIVYSMADLGLDIVREDDVIQQVYNRTDGLLNIVTLSEQSYRIEWYKPSDVGAKVDSRYTFSGSPVKQWTISNPENDPKRLRRFHVLEQRGNEFSFDYLWAYYDQLNDWVFTRGKGPDAVVESKHRVDGNNEFTETRILRTESGKIAKKFSKTYGIFAFGVQLKNEKEIGESVEKTTSYIYYTTAGQNGYGQVKKITYPDGSYTEYTYDANKRPLTVKRPTAFGDEILTYTYSADPTETRPLSIVKKINGTSVLSTTYIYIDDPVNGNKVTTSQTSDGVTQSSSVEYYGTNAGEFAQGRLAKRTGIDGVSTTYTYEAQGDGGYVSTETMGNVANQSTQTRSYYSAGGNMVKSENYVNVGGSYVLVSSVENQYNPAHKNVKSIYSNGTTTEAAWICKGPTMQIDANGIKTEFFYDGAKRLIETKRYSPNGVQITTRRLDAADRVIEETLTCGDLSQTVQTVYDQLGRISKSVDPAGFVTTYSYSNDFLTTTVTNPRGATTIITRRNDGATASVTGTAVTPQYFNYSFANALQWTTTFLGANNSARWQKTYANGFGQATKSEQSTFGGTITSTNTYNVKGQLTQTTTTQSPTISYQYSPMGDLIKTTTTDGTTSRYAETQNEFEMNNNVIWQTSTQTLSCSDATIVPITSKSKKQLSNLSLDCEMKAVSIDARGNESIAWSTYDLATKIRTRYAQIPTASNRSIEVSIDGRTTTQTDFANITTTFEYDALGRKIATTDGRGNTQRMVYNTQGQLTESLDGAGNKTTYHYSQVGNLSAVTDALGNTTHYAYDVKGQKMAEWGVNAYPTRYEFDTYGNMISLYTFRNPQAVITDEPNPSNGDKTAWSYDTASNMLLSKTFANGKSTTYTYNLTGTLKSRTWARGTVTNYTYNTYGQLLKTTYSDAPPAITNTYFANGSLKTVADAVGTTTFTYNQYGEKTKESVSGNYIIRILSRNYDNFGREIDYSIGNSKKASYSYDASNGRLKTMNAVGAGNFGFDYMQNTHLQNRISYPNGMVKTTSFEDKRNLITGINYQNGNSVISNYTYENDGLGRRTNIGINYENAVKSNDYNYNPRSEVIKAQGNELDQSFDYDNIGNRITSENKGIRTDYTTNNLNQYENVGDFVPTFDDDGNQTLVKTEKGTFEVTYNGENRPVKFKNLEDNTFITMLYDYMGRRGGKLYYNSQGTWTSTAKFFYKDYTLIEESTASNVIQKEFVWDPTAGQATKPLFLRLPAQTVNLVYCHDANKNVTEVPFFATTNGIGAHYEYDTFGNTIVSTRNTRVTTVDIRTFNPFRFSSEYHDNELGLVYYNYRHYNPQIGHWLSRDPIEEKGGNNLYNFAQNNSLNSIDILGYTVIDAKTGNEISSTDQVTMIVQYFNSSNNLGGAGISFHNIVIEDGCIKDVKYELSLSVSGMLSLGKIIGGSITYKPHNGGFDDSSISGKITEEYDFSTDATPPGQSQKTTGTRNGIPIQIVIAHEKGHLDGFFQVHSSTFSPIYSPYIGKKESEAQKLIKELLDVMPTANRTISNAANAPTISAATDLGLSVTYRE